MCTQFQLKCFQHNFLFKFTSLRRAMLGNKPRPKISLHNIILNVFRLVLVLWSLLETNRAFSFMRHRCSKKFECRWKVHIVWVGLYFPRTLSTNLHYLSRSHFEWILHQVTNTRRNAFNIMLWRLLQEQYFCVVGYFVFVEIHNTMV